MLKPIYQLRSDTKSEIVINLYKEEIIIYLLKNYKQIQFLTTFSSLPSQKLFLLLMMQKKPFSPATTFLLMMKKQPLSPEITFLLMMKQYPLSPAMTLLLLMKKQPMSPAMTSRLMKKQQLSPAMTSLLIEKEPLSPAMTQQWQQRTTKMNLTTQINPMLISPRQNWKGRPAPWKQKTQHFQHQMLNP